jgi:predicted nucleic acid-binding protein
VRKNSGRRLALPEVISNTSPLQYLHQLGLLDLLLKSVGRITIPQAVADELEVGRSLGHDLPEVNSLAWIDVRVPASSAHIISPDLGHGETDVLRLALEAPADGEAVLILDDAKAREEAGRLGLKFMGTLGVLLDAKRAGLITAVAPHLNRLDALGFRLAQNTRAAVLKLAGEEISNE